MQKAPPTVNDEVASAAMLGSVNEERYRNDRESELESDMVIVCGVDQWADERRVCL